MFRTFDTAQAADEYRAILQAHHDDTRVPGTPRIIDLAVPTWDGKFALLVDEACPEGGELVDDINPPVSEEPLP